MNKKLIIFILSIFMGIINVKAFEFSKTADTLSKGEQGTIDVYVNLAKETKEINFNFAFSTYDVSASFTPAVSNHTSSGVSHSITFAEPATGKIKVGTITYKVSQSASVSFGTINISNGTATFTDDSKEALSRQLLTVTIANESIQEQPQEETPTEPQKEETKQQEQKKEEQKKQENKKEEKTTETKKQEEKKEEPVVETKEVVQNFIKEIKSSIVSIDLINEKYDYYVNVKEDVTKLDLEVVAIDDTYTVTISDQAIDQTKENNEIIIKVSDTQGTTQTYKINVGIIKPYIAKVDDASFKKDNSSKVIWGLLLVFFAFLTGVLSILHFYTKNQKKRK